jgi:FKBP-type peptidyl-prolyl cis-trans isomerase FkpA
MTRETTRWAAGLACVAVLALGCRKGPEAPAAAKASPKALATDDEKAIYAIGAMLGTQARAQIKTMGLSPAELEILQRAMADALAGRPSEIDLDMAGQKLVPPFAAARQTKAAIEEKERAKVFHDAAAKEEGATVLASGLIHRSLSPGKGPSPKATDTVRVHYQGTLIDGTEFDSSVKRGQPIEFALNAVIPCWGEGLQKMKVGEKARIVCPSDIAYGDQGRPPVIPGGATLVFEVELLGIKGR